VSVEQRLHHLRDLLASRSRFSFDDAVRGADRLTEAVTLFALLELYKAGEAQWEQEVPFGPITVVPAAADSAPASARPARAAADSRRASARPAPAAARRDPGPARPAEPAPERAP
jgi:hypothetical protein